MPDIGNAPPESTGYKFLLWTRWLAKFILLPILRVVQASLVVALAVWLGKVLGRTEFLRSLPPGGLEQQGLTIVSFLSAAKELRDVLPNLWTYIRTGSWGDLYSFSSFIFFTSLTLGFIFLAGGGNPAPSDVVPPAGPVLFVRPGHEPTFLVPFTEEATKPNNDCNPDSGFVKGLEPFKGTDAFLGKLMDGLYHCAAARPVSIEVRGFASSSEFKGCSNSNEINKRLANERAKVEKTAMDSYLDSHRYGGKITVTPYTWANFDDMRRAASFNDKNEKGTIDVDRADLTRRVDVSIVDAAGCEPSR